MEANICLQAFLLLLLFCAAIKANAKICNVSKWVESTESVTVYHEEPVMESYIECTVGGLWCTEKTGVKYLKNSRVTYRIGRELRNVSTCCHGYSGAPPLCNDIDECQYDNGGCVHYCHNTEGSYHCSCYDGYGLSIEDKRNCIRSSGRHLKKRSNNDQQEWIFYFAVPRHHYNDPSYNYAVITQLHVVNLLLDESISYTVKMSSTQITSGTIPAESSQSIHVASNYTVLSEDYQYRELGLLLNTTGKSSALLVTSAHQSTGETPLYPYEQLDQDEYEYYAVSTGSNIPGGSHGFILLVGIADTTTVTLKSTVQLEMANDPQVDDHNTVNVNAGETKKFTIKRLQTIYIQATHRSDDLSGSKITSNKQLTVITGHEFGSIPATAHGYALIMQQVPQTLSWGEQFMVSPYEGRSSQSYQIMASESSTTVKHTCGTEPVTTFSISLAGKNKLIETGADKYCYIEANKPVLVTQMSPSKGSDEIGDPDISILPDIERYITNEYTFHVPNVDSIKTIYLNIVSKTKDAFTLNGTSQCIEWNDIDDLSGNTIGHYITEPISLTAGSNITIASSNDDTEFYILVYGFEEHKAFSFTSVFFLECDEGYEKSYGSCEDIDECKRDEPVCNDDEMCNNTLGSYTCSKCEAGYQVDNDKQCVDIDECLDSDLNCCEQLCNNTEGSYECDCNEGYKIHNQLHCVDIDECDSMNGGCKHSCTNTPGSFKCSCKAGFKVSNDGFNCTDIDECTAVQNGGCFPLSLSTCFNTFGSYYCSCSDGYQLDTNGHKCIDENECATNNGGCDDICTNTDGSYTCQCTDGRSLDSDNHGCSYIKFCELGTHECDQVCYDLQCTYHCGCNLGYTLNKINKTSCDDINECTEHISGCNHICANTIGSYECSCNPGYTLDSDGKTCNDDDECYIDNGGCKDICENTPGSYYCDCSTGYTLNSDKISCENIDECTLNTDYCEQNCHDTNGSYTCSCNTGYILDSSGYHCKDTDECHTNIDGCTDTCTNTPGSYQCGCDDIGYELGSDKHTCVDINECDSHNGGCDHTCNNTVGSYHCECNSGYELDGNKKGCSPYCADACNHCTLCASPGNCTCDDGWTGDDCCTDINECNTLNGGCEGTCHNTPGSFGCSCESGYTLYSDGKSCNDTDECAEGTHTCDDVCTNTDGSYECLCNDGYELGLDKKTCTAICSDACGHCDECTQPDLCTCVKGWTGNDCCNDTDECATNNGGCEHNCTNAEGSFTCGCAHGYSLRADGLNCEDVNECSKDSDNECNHNCTNTHGSYSCYCMEGYELAIAGGFTCIDTNECLINNGGCDDNAECVNTEGGYSCTCHDGYVLDDDGHTCNDSDECKEGTHGCSDECYNNIGSYSCDCETGFELDTDQETCIDTNECAVANGGCHHKCNNTEGSYSCYCNPGFSLDSDKHGCSDRNECELDTDSCSQICHNSRSSYYCTCKLGYLLDEVDSSTCNDINECTEHVSGCCQVCNNTDGSYTCSCYNGYTLNSNGRTCDDNNECFTNNGGCGHTCDNTPLGSYTCSCNDGYKLDTDKHSCIDINECELNTDTCEHICNNTEGSFKCSCNPGYQSEGIHCEDIDECLTSNGGCTDACTNTPGSYQCGCDDIGYELGSDKHTCVDINECDSHNGGCDHTCSNTVGSYHCECNSEYELDGDKKGCSPVCADACNHCTLCASPGHCTCDDGWTGDDCCTDINECDTLNGGCEGTCHNTPGSFACSCESGYSLYSDGKSCNDTDECAEGTHTCDHVCTNTPGSYTCSCNSSKYELNLDKQTCTAICPDACGHCDECTQPNMCTCVKGWTGNDCCNDIDECATNNGGCEHNCTNAEGSFTCDCAHGYSLRDDGLNCEDVNECSKDSDNECNQYCTNTHGSYSCYCMEGYELAIAGGFTCIDTNECLINNGGCDNKAECVNTEGGYNCTCHDGYVLDDDGHTCNDIDECKEGTHDCSHECYNNEGGYSCDCDTGFELDTDQETCVDINECADANGGCDHKCNNTKGNYSCYCNPGFTLDSDKHGCSDHDECELGTDSCSQICHNSHSSYYCTCKLGYEIDQTNSSACNDINECTEHVSGCSQVCTNTDGSYTCSCYNGYTLNSNGRACNDNNECFNNNGGCNHTCDNTPLGSYTCSCNDGYKLDTDKHSCIDINECELNTDTCEQNCNNTEGSFKCSCNPGYQSEGIHCEDINECLTSNGGCTDTCTNTPGSYQCGCDDIGYKLDSDGHSCVDINECNNHDGGCDHTCVNTVGSYYCKCNSGYELDIDDKGCSPICADAEYHCQQCVSPGVCLCEIGWTGPDCTYDINECNTLNGECQHNCVNTPGSFACYCDDGYTEASDGLSCDDIDECSSDSTNECNQVCNNTIGSYTCSCYDGYQLGIDDKTCLPICTDECGQCVECVSPQSCTCNEGWTGSDCCKDINECDDDNGGCEQICFNGNGTFVCDCDEGYTLNEDHFTCDNIDECLSNETNDCNHMCIDTIGSYNCSCDDGYELALDYTTCVDTDECAMDNANGGCEHTCINEVGSYHCECKTGYSLNEDNHACDDIDECKIGTHNCSHNCYNNNGSYTCDCDQGFKLDTDSLTCIDVDECYEQGNGGCAHDCINTNGSYYCECIDGYVLDEDGRDCIDERECKAGTHECDQHCHNTNGSYYCTCDFGYTLEPDGKTCEDVNECMVHCAGCNQICINTIGSYICDCHIGFELKDNNRTCIDIDECLFDNGGCNQTCTNTTGSYKCSCDEGYKLNTDRHGCDDINECALGIDLCEHNCHNNVGSYNCSCITGYYLEGNGFNCSDVDECSIDNGGCNQTCVNEIGSYNCECKVGFLLHNDSHDCIDVDECDSDNGGCQHNCHNDYGSYSCSCYEGYDLLEDSHSCYGQPCNETLIAPINGSISCTGEQITNQSCSFQCDPGYDIHESISRTCQPDHTWSGVEPYCTIRHCRTLRRPWNAYIASEPCFTEFTSRCHIECVKGYHIEGEVPTKDMYQECMVDPQTNEMYWSDPPECVYKPPCTSSPCLNGGHCRDVDNYQYKCDCTGTQFKGQRCEVGVITIQQAPRLTEQEAKILAVEAHPTTELHLHLSVEGNGIEISTTQLSFTSYSTMALYTVTAVSRGVHFIHFNLTGVDANQFEIPQSMIVIVQSSSSNHTSYRYFNNQALGVLDHAMGCCNTQSPYLTCPDPIIQPSLLSSCAWIDSTETFGVVFASNNKQPSSLPISVAGAYLNSNSHLLLSLPRSYSTCTQCNNTHCQSFDLTEDDIVDFIKTHALVKSILEFTNGYLPDWIDIEKKSEIDSSFDGTFNSYDIVADVVYGEDIVLINDCENLNLVSGDLYAVVRSKISLILIVDMEYINLPEFEDSPVCFAVSLCDQYPMVHISIPVGHQEYLEQIERLKNIIERGWELNIFEVGLSNVPRDIAYRSADTKFTLPNDYSSLNNTNDSTLPQYSVSMELSISKLVTMGDTSMEFTASTIAYFPQTPSKLQGVLIGDIHLNINMSLGDQTASLDVTQIPGKPVPFVLPGYSNDVSSYWTNGAYLMFEYSPSDFDQLFSSILPPPPVKHSCLADMFIEFSAIGHNISSIVMTTSCTGLNIQGLTLPSGVGEHRVTIIPNERIMIESNIIGGEYQVNEFMRLTQPVEGYAISVSYYTNASVIGEIRNTDLVLFGSILSDITLNIADNVTFTTEKARYLYNIELNNTMIGTLIGSNGNTHNLVFYITSTVTDMTFFSELEVSTKMLVEKEIALFDSRQEDLESSRKQVQKLFYHYSDIVGNLQQELVTFDTLYEEAVEKADNLTQLLEQYQTEVDQLVLKNIAELNDTLMICQTDNCSSECAIDKTCDVCKNVALFPEWSVGLVEEEDHEVVTYKKYSIERKWIMGYFCRLITLITSWGKTAYGQVCSDKSGYDDEVRTSRWVSENKECNSSHFRSVHVGDHPTVIDRLCLLNNTDANNCGMYLKSSECVLSNSACSLAQLELIKSLDQGKQSQLEPMRDLIEVRSSLSIAMTKMEEYRYRRDSTKCMTDFNGYILQSLDNQLAQMDDSYESFMVDNSYILDIKSLLLNYSLDNFFTVKGISFETTLSDITTSTIPLLVWYETEALNTTSELLVSVDFRSTRSIIKRDISLAVMKDIKNLVTAHSRNKRNCDLTEPSVNEHHFEEYCARINSIKQYFIDINNTLNMVINNADEMGTQLEGLIEYDLVDTVSIDANLSLLNTYIGSPLTESQLLQLALSSMEYIELTEALEIVQNATKSASLLVKDTVDISWWLVMNLLHLTSYNRIIDDRKCYGFGDCLKIVIVTLEEIIEDYPLNNFDPVVDEYELHMAEEYAMEAVSNINGTGDDTWTLLESLYEITLEVEQGTNWCTGPPEFTSQPDEFIYVEVGGNAELVCDLDSNSPVSYMWYRNGFPIQGENDRNLSFSNVTTRTEGQYYCSISNNVGITVSGVSNVLVYTRPILTLSPINQTTYEGNEDDALFVCNATGHPTPVYNWYYSIDKLNWSLIANGSSNEFVVYKPATDSEGWYRCQASIYDHLTVQSDPAYLTVIGASVSKLSYAVNFSMAIYSIDAVTPLNDGYTQGLQNEIVTAFKRNEIWQYGFIENMILEVDHDARRLDVSFYLSTYYDYSLTKTLVDQAEVADQQHQELVMILDRMNIHLEDSCASISFEYENDFFYTFPRTVVISHAFFGCDEGKELMNNTFICINCSIGLHSAIVNNIPMCVECEQGTYNGQVGRGQCTPCPEHMSTLETGHITDEKCQNVCLPNTYSSNGITNCTECPIGTYQPNYGSTNCINCSFNDTLNESFTECYVSPSETTFEPSMTSTEEMTFEPSMTSTKELPGGLTSTMMYIIVAIALTVTIVAALTILIVVVIVRQYKKKGSQPGKKGNPDEFELHNFNERRTENPLYSMEHDNEDPNVVYDRVRVNPMAMGRIRQARRNFETRPTSLPPTNEDHIYHTADGDDGDSLIEELPVDAYEGSDIDSENCKDQDFDVHSVTKSQLSEEDISAPVQTTSRYENTTADKYHGYKMFKPATH